MGTMTGVFELELHDVETLEVDGDSDDAIELEEVNNITL